MALATAGRLLAVAGVLSRPNLEPDAYQPALPPTREMVEWASGWLPTIATLRPSGLGGRELSAFHPDWFGPTRWTKDESMADAADYTLQDLLQDLRNYEATLSLAKQASDQSKDPLPANLKGLAPHEVDYHGFAYHYVRQASEFRNGAAKIKSEIDARPGVDRIETFCRARARPFDADSLEMLCAQAAERDGKTLGEFLQLDVVAGAGLLAGELPHAKPKQGQGLIDQARSWLQSRFLEAPEKTKSHDVIRVYEPGGVSRSARDEEKYFLALPREEFHAYLLSIGAPVAETIRLCQAAGWITVREGGFGIRNLQSFYGIMPAVMASSTQPGAMSADDEGSGRSGSTPTTSDTKGETTDSARDKVFISYSHKDRRWLDDLMIHLKPYLRDGSVTAWSDQQIAPGSKWFAEIKAAIAATKVAVLLVTPDFLASDFIHEHELGPLLKKVEVDGVRIIWLPVRSCSYQKSPIKDYQAVIDPKSPPAGIKAKADRDREWVRVCEEIERAVIR